MWQLACSKNPNSYHRVKAVIKLFLSRGIFVKKSVSFYPSTSGNKKLTQLPTQFYLLLDNHYLKKLVSPLHFHWPCSHLRPTAQIISWVGPCCHVGSTLLPSPTGWVIMNWANQHSNNWNKTRLAVRSLDGSGAKRSYRRGADSDEQAGKAGMQNKETRRKKNCMVPKRGRLALFLTTSSFPGLSFI